MNNSSESADEAQERHGEFQLVLNEQRRKYSECISAQEHLKGEIAKSKRTSRLEALHLLELELVQLENQSNVLREALEEAELEAERLYYQWVLAIWRSRRINNKRVLEILNTIKREISQHSVSAEDACAESQKNTRHRYLTRAKNLKYFQEQLSQLLED